MGSISGLFSAENPGDFVRKKMDDVNMWIRLMEKQNKPFYVEPKLYFTLSKKLKNAYDNDFNLIIEEFPFYQ